MREFGRVWDKKSMPARICVYVCVMTSKLPAVKGLPCVQNHLTWADASLKPCHTRRFPCQTPQPFSLSPSLAVFFISFLLRISHTFHDHVQMWEGEKSIPRSLLWPIPRTLRTYLSVCKITWPCYFFLVRSFFFFSGQTVASKAPLIKSKWPVGCATWPATTFWC